MARRGRGEGGIGRRADGTWYSTVSLGTSPDGKRLRKYFYGASKAEVVKARDEWERAKEGAVYDPSNETLGEYLKGWLTDVSQNRRYNTWRAYEAAVERHIAPYLGQVRVAKLTPMHVEDWLRKLVADEAGSAARRYAYVVLKVALKKAIERRRIADPFLGIERPRHEVAEMQTWSAEEVRAFLKAAEGTRYYPLYLLALTTMMRLGELLGLHWEDIDLKAGVLHVRMQLIERDSTIIGRAPPKSKSGVRTIPLAPDVVAALKAHRVRQFEAGAAAVPWVFTTLAKAPLHKKTVHEAFHAVSAKAGVKQIRFHDLRHTAASQAIKSGASVKTVQELLGHSNVAITIGTYIHSDAEQHAGAVSTLHKVFTGGEVVPFPAKEEKNG